MNEILENLTFVIGANATGKSHFITTNYAGRKDVDVLNVYDYQQRAYDEAGFGKSVPLGSAGFRCLMKANDMLLEDIIEKLKKGRNVVVEQTFFKAKRRIAYIDEIRKAVNVTIEMYVMCPSDDLWKAYQKKRKLEGTFESYKNQAKDIEFPNPAEGIDRIYEVVDGEIRLRMDTPKPEILDKAREELAKETARIRSEDETKQKRKELLESMSIRPFWHYCEVCGRKEFITAQDAFDNGWDYPPNIGHFGLLGPRTCGNCFTKDTLFWRVNAGKVPIVVESALSPEELVTWKRIRGEPESLLDSED